MVWIFSRTESPFYFENLSDHPLDLTERITFLPDFPVMLSVEFMFFGKWQFECEGLSSYLWNFESEKEVGTEVGECQDNIPLAYFVDFLQGFFKVFKWYML